MKLLQLSFHFEFTDNVEEILHRHGLRDFIRYPRVDGRDEDGMHDGSRVHPGNLTVIQAPVSEEDVDAVLDDLKRFRDERKAHQHLQAFVAPIEKTL